jgi:hypothetical protein
MQMLYPFVGSIQQYNEQHAHSHCHRPCSCALCGAKRPLLLPMAIMPTVFCSRRSDDAGPLALDAERMRRKINPPGFAPSPVASHRGCRSSDGVIAAHGLALMQFA